MSMSREPTSLKNLATTA